MAKGKSVNLIVFLKGSTKPKERMPGCGNYDAGNCLSGKACKVERGGRCGYFEKIVLPTAFDIGLGDKMYSLYEAQCKISGLLDKNRVRTCPDCGTGLRRRQRYCDLCRKRRRKVSYRKARRNRRSKRNS